MNDYIIAKKDGATGCEALIGKRYPMKSAYNLLGEGYTLYSEKGERLISWSDVESILKGIKTIEFKIQEVR